ncbi:hypothetical protein RGQ29_002013 [Quercus rubra]|uniref:NAC domain-containing protein n=1 Tax=Quercus rubra TaxID=3512 RepID=A0AAN7GI65_QUERU|nr:hypothetical protein RGQ29_002013 [Quercus rubra]
MNDLCKLKEEQLKEHNPLGFCFDPTDKELVKYYLKSRVLNKPLPKLSFMEVDLYNQNLDTLAEQKIIMAKKCGIFSPQGIESIKMEAVQIELPEMDIGRPMELKSK